MMESGPVAASSPRRRSASRSVSGTSSRSTWAAPPPRQSHPRRRADLGPGYYVGGYASGHPVMLPMIDVVEVGAGAAASLA